MIDFSDKNLIYKPLIVYRLVYFLFISVCTGLIYFAVNTDVERVKLDSAADFSSRVQQLETVVRQFETLATIVAQAMTHSVKETEQQQFDSLLNLFNLENNLLTLTLFNDQYRSGLYSEQPSSPQEESRLQALFQMGVYIPHFLYEERIEKVTIYSRYPRAKLIYPRTSEGNDTPFLQELSERDWQNFWAQHEQQAVNWQIVSVGEDKKLVLSASILDAQLGVVGVVQLSFSLALFDQEIYKPSGPDSVVFLAELKDNPRLIATSPITDFDLFRRKQIAFIEGELLPSEIATILLQSDKWVYQSDEYFVFSVPIADIFNFVYVTDVKGFSLTSSVFTLYGLLLLVSLLFLGIFVDRLISRYLSMLKAQDETLKEKNKLLTTTLRNLETTQRELIHKEKVASLGGVVAGLAHQLNTPLGNATTAASYISESLATIADKMESGLKKSELQDFIGNSQISSQLIGSNIKKASTLVDNFKLLAGDEASDDIRLFRVVDYTDVVLQGLRPTLEGRRIKTRISGDKQLELFSYPIAYTQIIVQLVNNAIIHGLAQDGQIEISVNKAPTSGHIVVVIADNGVGIKQEEISRIFEPFFTGKCAAEQVGLGLTIVHNLVVAKMQGEIKVSSVEGKGCEFTVELPNVTLNSN